MAVRERLQSIVQKFVMSKPQYAYITGKSIDGAIARVVQHCAYVWEQMKRAVPTVHDRRSRKTVKACCGGAMLSLDLSRAFDEVPRESLSAALDHAKVPSELRDLIIALHVQCVYKVTHKGQTGVFPMRKGVRQGCALSPLLFTLFTCHIYDVLASRTSHTWAQQAITLFADDSHFTWIINHVDDLRFLVRSVRATFQTFREFGMQLNMDKSRFVVKLQGGAAKRWLKARTLCSDKGPVMQFGKPHSPILIPRVHSMVYLGIIASYTGFESQTFEHRRQAALGCKHRLGRVLRSKRLQLRQRARLYVACVRSSLLYGLTAVGVTGHVVRKLDQFDSRALRSLARSPAFLSHESSEALRKRLNVSSPSKVLHQALERRIAKSSDAQEHQWFAAKLQELQDVLAVASSSSNLRSADAQEGVACPDCGIYFPSFRIMRSHRARSHKQLALKVQAGMLAAQDYVAGGVDGMPACRWCRRIFTRVEGLKKHHRKGCPKCRKDVETSQTTREPEVVSVSPGQVPGMRGGLLGHPCRTSPTTSHDVVRVSAPSEDSLVAVPAAALLKDPAFQQLARQHWKRPLENADYRARLKEYCVICGQWCARAKQHQRLMHPEAWLLHDAAVSQCCSAGLRALRLCSFCSTPVQQPGRHLRHCVVMYQASLASLLLCQDRHGLSSGGTGGGACEDGTGGAQAGNGGSLLRPADAGPCGGEGASGGRAPSQMGQASMEGRQRSITGWLVPGQLGQRVQTVATCPAGGQERTATSAGPGNAGPDEQHGPSNATPRGRDPTPEARSRIHGLHRYFRPGMPFGAPPGSRKLAGAVHEGHCDKPIAPGDVHGTAGNATGHSRGDACGWREAPAVPECGLDGGGRPSSQSQVGLPFLGSGGEEASGGGGPAIITCGRHAIDRSADDAHPKGRSLEELQDYQAHECERSVQGRGSPVHGVHRLEGGIQCNLLQCAAHSERLGLHEADRSTGTPRAGTGNPADQAAEAVLYGHHLLRVDATDGALERRCLGRHAAAALEEVQLARGANSASLTLPQARLRNSSNLCYCNAIFHCVYWLGEVSTSAQACYGSLQAGIRILRTTGDLMLPRCMALHALFRGWRQLHNQHDAGEFLQRFLAVAQPDACVGGWEARLTNPHRVRDSGDLGIPLFLHLPGESLQALVDSWQHQFATHALTHHGGCIFLQICRYSAHDSKNMQRVVIRPGATVTLPVFTDAGNACTRLEQFRVVAAVFHQGQSTTSGHYQAIVGKPEAEQWVPYICDDNRKPRKAQRRDLDIVDHNAYLVGLLRSP